jgi:alpha-L-rhamnosidase
LQHNIVWGQKGNFVDVPTDCPQRDERLGWTGDAQVFVRTACFNRDVAAFFSKWLLDLTADQHPNGSVPFVSPDVPMMPGMSSAGATGWGDAAIICPWTIYLSYGDKHILERQYESMAAWVNFMREQAGERYLWASGFHFGDWLDFRGNSPLVPSPVTNVELIATAFFAYSAGLMQQIATVLGKDEDAASYAQLGANIKKAFNAEFVAPNGRVGPNSQSAYVLALHFDLLPEKMRPLAAARLADEVRKANYHLTTGFLGTPYLCQVLSRFGYTDLAYELLNQESFPSWLYPVKKGATTIWERWDGIKPDGSFQDVSMNSFNHYSYGAIGEWMYRVVAGIEADPNAGGYKHFFVQPKPGGGLTHAKATLQSPYGEIASAWQLSEGDLRLQVTVPPNTRATVRLPAKSLSQVKEVVDGKGKAMKAGNGVLSAKAKGGVATIELGSGQYEFVTTGINLAQAHANVRHIAGRLDRGTSLRDLLASADAKAILVKHLGEDVVQGAQSPFVINNSLDAMTRYAPQVVTEERMRAIEGELSSIQN